MDFRKTTRKDIQELGKIFVKLGFACGDFDDWEAKRDNGEMSEDEFQSFFSRARNHGINNSIFPFAIGGSDTSAVLGISKYGTPAGLIREKEGLLKRDRSKSEWLFFRGHVFETPYRMVFEKQTGKTVLPCAIQFKHPDYPHLLADIDGIVIDGDGTLQLYEGKTTTPYTDAAEDFKSGKCPESYYCQIQYYMGVLNTIFKKIGEDKCFTRCYINCGMGMDMQKDVLHLIVKYDPEFAKMVFERCEELVQHAIEGTFPSFEAVKVRTTVLDDSFAVYGPPDPSVPLVKLPDTFKEHFEALERFAVERKENLAAKAEYTKEHEEIIRRYKELDSANEKLGKKEKLEKSYFVDEIKNGSGGYLETDDKKYTIQFKREKKYSLDKATREYFEKTYPEAYADIMLKCPTTRSVTVSVEEK